MYPAETVTEQPDLQVTTAKLERNIESLLSLIGDTRVKRIHFLTLVDLSSRPPEVQFAVNALAAAGALLDVVNVNLAQVDTIAVRQG
jgi:hypothetical protein